MITPDTISYRSRDGRKLQGYRWSAADEYSDVGTGVIVHGMGEHLQRYHHLANALASQGFTVYGHDHRGHGASLRGNDQPGLLGPDGWAALVEDLALPIHQAKSDHPGLPVILIAHSMGSFAAQQFLPHYGCEIDALALTGTAALDLLEPALDLTKDLDLSMFNAAFQPTRTDFDWLSRDESMVDAYLADPLCGFGIDAESVAAMFAGACRAAEAEQLAKLPNDLPVYLAAGSKDPVNADLSLLWALADRYRAAGLDDVTVRVYDDDRHEIFNEIDRSRVIQDLLDWLRRVATAPRRTP